MKDLKNTENYKEELIAAYFSDELTGEKKTLVESWKNESEENRHLFNKSRAIMANAVLFFKTRQFNTNRAWDNVRSGIRQQIHPSEVQGRKQLRIRLSAWLKYAAILVFAVVSGTMVYYLAFSGKPSKLIEIQSSARVLGNQLLPDGTHVALNNHSVIRFPENFKGNTREVHIEGEAFFEVKPDSTKPFIINAGRARIKVLGTSFNISAYPDGETVEVVVKTGKVQVSVESENKSDNTVILRPGEKGTLFNKNEQLVKSVNSDSNFLAWNTRLLTFRETPLEDVIQSLEKIYSVKIQTGQTAIGSLKLTARFDDQSIDYVLEVIRLTFDLELKTENGQFIFTMPIR